MPVFLAEVNVDLTGREAAIVLLGVEEVLPERFNEAPRPTTGGAMEEAELVVGEVAFFG